MDHSVFGGESAGPDGLTPPEPSSLSDQAYNRILELILEGKLAPGTMLQERRLAELLNMSRTPIREALGRLEGESLITRRHGRAPVVSKVSVESFVWILDMRRILEVEAAGRATGRLPPEQVAAVVQAVDALLARPNPTPAEHWTVDDLVHNTIADAAGNPLVSSTIRDLRRQTHLFNSARLPQRLMPGATEHLIMMEAVGGNDPDKSREVMARHLDNVRDAIIEFLLGTGRS
jgi:DNA-binding GntR family transcriptional regulator